MSSQSNTNESIGFFELLDEMEGEDAERREAAKEAHRWLSRLVAMRCRENGTNGFVEWLLAFDQDALVRDARGKNDIRAKVAFEALDAVNHLEALRDVANYEPTEEDRIWADNMRANMKRRLDELRGRRE